MLPETPVHKNQNDDYGYRQRRRAVTDNLGVVFFEKIDYVPDFERKLAGLQFFTGDSGHENVRLETFILAQWDRPAGVSCPPPPQKDLQLPIDTAHD